MKVDKEKIYMFIDKIKTLPLNLHTVLGGLAILGFIGSCSLVYLTSRNLPTAKPLVEPSSAPYEDFISGAGMIESAMDNIKIGSVLAGIIKEVFVKVGDKVKKGDALFSLDTTQAQSDVELKKQQVVQAHAALCQAEASMTSAKESFDIVENVKDKRAISKDDYQNRKNSFEVSKASLENAKATLEVVKAQLNVSEKNLELMTVKAPLDGEILQVNVHHGEYANNQTTSSTPFILFGLTHNLQIRIDVDETDAWRFKKYSKAIAYVRGNTKITIPLEFHHIEPYVLPKVSLTGASTERVDVRVLQVIYTFKNTDPRIYVGQQVDAYIESAKLDQ